MSSHRPPEVLSPKHRLVALALAAGRSTRDIAQSVPPPVTLLQMMTGYWVSQALYVAAKLGVADLLADGPRTAEALAAATQTDAPSLQRVLRALASVGVFTEVHTGLFALTPLAPQRDFTQAAVPPRALRRGRRVSTADGRAGSR
jgi:hypothetical protein